MTRTLGYVDRVIPGRGFAFLRDADGHELFLHRNGCEPPGAFDTLRQGDAVSFRVTRTVKGPRAFDTQRATPEEAQTLPAYVPSARRDA